MKFAKVVFWVAGCFNVLAIAPMYFLLDEVGRMTPPPVTHPQFYYGFVGVVVSWGVAFCLIGTNPARFRPLMVPSMLEKFSFVIALTVLYLKKQILMLEALPAGVDLIFGVLFLIAYFKTRS